MTSRNRPRFVLLALVLSLLPGVEARAQRAVSTGPQNAPLTAAVPVDPRITIGTLPNGLRYYLRANKQPLGRAELRLVVNAGSILEEDDQRGLPTSSSTCASTGHAIFRNRTWWRFCSRPGCGSARTSMRT